MRADFQHVTKQHRERSSIVLRDVGSSLMFLLLHSSSNRHTLLCWLHFKAFVDDFIYKREPLSCSLCLAYGGCLLLFGLLSRTFKKHHYSLLLILTVSEFLYISFHSCPIPLSLTSYLILSPFSHLIFLTLLSISSLSSLGFSTVMPQLDLPLIAVTFSLRGTHS